MDNDTNDIENFLLMIENVGYELYSTETKDTSKSTSKFKTIETMVYKDSKEEEMLLYKTTTVYNGIIWFLVWKGYKQNLNNNTIPSFIRILKSQYNNRLRSAKIKRILNGSSQEICLSV